MFYSSRNEGSENEKVIIQDRIFNNPSGLDIPPFDGGRD